jgi:hypothetical protein
MIASVLKQYLKIPSQGSDWKPSREASLSEEEAIQVEAGCVTEQEIRPREATQKMTMEFAFALRMAENGRVVGWTNDLPRYELRTMEELRIQWIARQARVATMWQDPFTM